MRTPNLLKPLIEQWLPDCMNGNTAHKTDLLFTLRRLTSRELQSDLLAHLKTTYADNITLANADPEVLFALAQWVETLLQQTGTLLPEAIRQDNQRWALNALAFAANEQQYPPALYRMASQYGTGVPPLLEKDSETALTYLREAAELDYPMAQHDMAQNYQRGVGELLSKDPERALDYYSTCR